MVMSERNEQSTHSVRLHLVLLWPCVLCSNSIHALVSFVIELNKDNTAPLESRELSQN